ncbi:MAG: UDP-N-acetylmuramoylalanine--D-glutamate ligase [Pedosphaera sp.]|nr:UDP-N-acetylmuramoylalanine--D-glutamate ligase [Pedosphaera sp.]
MYELANKQVLVIGLGARGRAACELLRGSGAHVMAVDQSDTADLRAEAGRLRPLGVEVELGVSSPPDRQFSLAVVSPAVPGNSSIVQEMRQRQVPVIGEFELGYQQAKCLSIAVAGTNGKGTTAELIDHLLAHNHRKIALCGHGARPVCSVAMETKDLDFLVLQVNSFQLETTRFFRPAVGVLLNLTPDHSDRYASHADYVRANARLFANQQSFDWAIVQSEALAQLRSLEISLPSKVITFSANNRNADIFLDRGLLMSRLPDWSWPLLNTEECRLRGPHNAENLMAALAVGHVLRLPLDAMVDVLKAEAPGPHRCERVAEINGVQFINDSKATNVDALHKALLSVAPAGSRPNVWLIAGGKDKGLEYHDVGPLLSQRVKGTFLIGEAREKIRAAWSLFTPCTLLGSLLEAVSVAVKNAVPGDVVLLSPACSSFDQFRNYQHRGEVFRHAVLGLMTPAHGGSIDGTPITRTLIADNLK